MKPPCEQANITNGKPRDRAQSIQRREAELCDHAIGARIVGLFRLCRGTVISAPRWPYERTPNGGQAYDLRILPTGRE